MTSFQTNQLIGHTGVVHNPIVQSGWQRLVKRVLDVVLASVTLLILAPVFVLVALWVRIDSRGPVIFRQERIGLGGKPFEMLKFRSMVANADPAVHRAFLASQANNPSNFNYFKVQGDPRITRAGRIIRKTSLDELPQLINVIRGDMSLVGPRPDVEYSLEQYEPHHHRRFDVLPGITGLWQVSGRSTVSLQEMLELDVGYVDTWSLSGDLWLLVKTIPEVVGTAKAG